MIKVDLRSKVIGADQRVFLVRPGSNYKLYNLFLNDQMIVADFLGLELKHGVPLREQDRLVEQLHRARKLMAHRRARGDVEPSRELNDYNGYVNDRGTSQLFRILSGFFDQAKKGDLVLVPPRSFSQDGLIGELLTDPTDFNVTTFPALYGKEALFGRRVRWLAKVPKGKLSPYLLDLISKPNAFVSIRKEERAALYREAYGSYILPGDYRARFNVTDDEFTTTDDLYIQAFFSFVAANSKRLQEGREVQNIHHAAFEQLGGYALELQSNINSPGYLNLISNSVAPLVASALLALAITIGPDAVHAAENGTILVGNSLDANDPCTVAIHAEVLQHLRLLGLERWTAACEIAQQAAASTGLSGQVGIVVEE